AHPIRSGPRLSSAGPTFKFAQEYSDRFLRAVIVEIGVPAQRKAYETLGVRCQREKPLAESDRHNSIAHAVQHEQGGSDPRDAFVGMEGILDQPAHRREWIGSGPYIGNGGKGRIEDDATDFALRGDSNCNAGPK